MSDFFQHGLISTLHRLVDGPIIGRNQALPALQSVILILPCHYAEIATPALSGIIEKLNEAAFLSQVVISMNGIPQHPPWRSNQEAQRNSPQIRVRIVLRRRN